MKKKLVVILLVLLVILLGCYAYWPYYTVGELEDALRLADRQKLEKIIDFPAVRNSLKAQAAAKKLSPARLTQTTPDTLANKMMAAAGLVFDQATDQLIDSMVTSDGLNTFLQAKRSLGKTEPTYEFSHPNWTGLNTCTIETTDKSKIKLKLTGLDGWHVIGFDPSEDFVRSALPKLPGLH